MACDETESSKIAEYYYPGMRKNMVCHATVHLLFPYSASNKDLENP